MIENKEVHPLKARSGIEVKLLMPVIVVKLFELLKHPVPMDVIVDGILKDVKPVPLNPELPIEVILEGIEHEVNDEHPENALSGIDVKPVKPVTVANA